MLVIIIPLVAILLSIYGIFVSNGTINPIGYKVKNPNFKKEYNNSEWFVNTGCDTETINFFSWICATIFSIWLIIDLCFSINLKRNFNEIMFNYDYIAAQVESYNKSKCDSYALIGGEKSLSDKVFDINETINYHYTHAGSIWNGIYVSEDIACLPILKFERKDEE